MSSSLFHLNMKIRELHKCTYVNSCVIFEVYFYLLIKCLGRKFPKRLQAVQLHVQKPASDEEWEKVEATCFPTRSHYTPGIMQACSWRINTRPYEVAVPAELQNMIKLPLTLVYHNLWHPMHLNHMIPSCQRQFPTLSKRNALSRLWRPAWAPIPVWLDNTFLYCIRSVLCSLDNIPALCCSAETVM